MILTFAAVAAIAVALTVSSYRNSVVGIEPPAFGFLLVAGLIWLFGELLIEITRLSMLWSGIEQATSAAAHLPMAPAFGRLPRLATAQFGSYAEALQGEDGGSPILPPVQQQQARALLAMLEEVAPDLDPCGVERARAHLDQPPTRRSGPAIARACVELLLPVWACRPARLAHSEPGGGDLGDCDDLAKIPGPRRATLRRFVAAAEEFVAVEVIRGLNRYLAAFWLRVTAVTVLALLLMMVVNSYPFRPAGRLFSLAMLAVILAVIAIVRSIWGFQRDALIGRVTGSAGRSVWNAEFIGRMATYVAPLVLGLIAMLSFAASDVLRAMLGPLF